MVSSCSSPGPTVPHALPGLSARQPRKPAVEFLGWHFPPLGLPPHSSLSLSFVSFPFLPWLNLTHHTCLCSIISSSDMFPLVTLSLFSP